MGRKASLHYDFVWYTPSNLKAMLEGDKELSSQVRKEYTRLRDVAQKRLKRLKEAGYEDTEAYRRNVVHYPKLKDIKTKSELAQRLSDLSRFIKSELSTVSGIKERERKTLESLSEHGYDFVNAGNLADFGDFMEQYRDQLLDMEYDSGDAAEVYQVAIKHKLDPEEVAQNFEFYLENLEVAKKLRRSKSDGNTEKFEKRIVKKNKELKKQRAGKRNKKKGEQNKK